MGEKNCRFACLTPHTNLPILFAVMEEVKSTDENIHSIVSIHLDTLKINQMITGEDFYIDLTIAPNGHHLAFSSWNHPNMPWDATSLQICTLDTKGAPVSTLSLNQETTTSFIQPLFKNDHELFYVANQTGYWNIYSYNIHLDEHKILTKEEADFGYPPWQYGFKNYCYEESINKIYAISTICGINHLYQLDLTDNTLLTIPLQYTSLEQIICSDTSIYLIASNYNTPQTLISINTKTHHTTSLYQPETVNPQLFSKPLSIKFSTSNDKNAYGLFYPPLEQTKLDPLIIRCHGGPTAYASTHCQKEIAFWTTRGFAFFDINYRGSFGYGKTYQDLLNGKWGILDTDDCYFAAKFLVEHHYIDPTKLFIQGSSSGGYTALQTLSTKPPKNTFPFAGGISFYGITDLNLLENETHKFEKYYLQKLLDIPKKPSVLKERSPIHNINNITAPILFLQGEDDLVVPKNQAQMMQIDLERKGIPSEVILFSDEGHGFRKATTIEKALTASLAFYSNIIL